MLRIRPMRAGDLKEVVSLYRAANPFARSADIRAWTSDGLKRFPTLNLVAEDSSGVVAALSATQPSRQKMQIEDIVVRTEKRGGGIGSLLMKKILQEARYLKVRHIELWVHWKNAAAVPFYYRHGFNIKKVLVTKGIPFVPDGEDVILMQCSL